MAYVGRGAGGIAGKCCCSCCGFIFTIGLFVLIYWAIFQPHHIRATVESATLSDLTVVSNTSSAAVSYKLAVWLSLYNPSVRVNVYYDTLDAELRFRDAVIGPAAGNTTGPTAFFQRARTGDDVKLEFEYGRPGVADAGDVAGELEKEVKRGEPVRLELHILARVRYVFRMFKLRQKPMIRCELSIPVRKEGRRSGVVGGDVDSGDRCRVKY